MPHAASKRVHARVTGVVQGVFYRASTRQQAQALALSGWVRNTPDGAVELEAQGPGEAVDALLAWCRQGPPMARVDALDVREIEPLAEDGGFQVRY